MKKITLYHGSAEIIEKPEFGKGKPYNDYGLGFYCTEHVELAKEWACPTLQNGYVNKYEFNAKGLTVLDLSDEKYHCLNWLAILMENRRMILTAALAKRGRDYILDNFLPNYKSYDIIKGYRADDSYFAFVRAFVNSQISVRQLRAAMSLGDLGEQIVLKSKLAFERIEYAGSEPVDASIYFPRRKERDRLAKTAYQRESSDLDTEGLYIRDIIARGIKNGDQILR